MESGSTASCAAGEWGGTSTKDSGGLSVGGGRVGAGVAVADRRSGAAPSTAVGSGATVDATVAVGGGDFGVTVGGGGSVAGSDVGLAAGPQAASAASRIRRHSSGTILNRFTLNLSLWGEGT